MTNISVVVTHNLAQRGDYKELSQILFSKFFYYIIIIFSLLIVVKNILINTRRST